MTLSFPGTAHLKQYLPGLYFIGVAAYITFESNNLWFAFAVVPFVVQMLMNNRYLNLVLGILTILWSGWMGFAVLLEAEKGLQFISVALCLTVANLYMSRMLFLNQNFAVAQLRENSLDEILFL